MPLPQLPDCLPEGVQIDASRITVSGISAGAFMAHQLHVAYSDIFSGAGLMAGGPFQASGGSLVGALSSGLFGVPAPDGAQALALAVQAQRAGHIAPLANLYRHRVWLFHGQDDSVVTALGTDALATFYRELGLQTGLADIRHVAAPHALPSRAAAGAPYVVDCGFDAAGELLAHLHGRLKPRTQAVGSLRQFDQSAYLTDPVSHGMETSGLLYVPRSLRPGQSAPLHVVLHGCEQASGVAGAAFAEQAGYNEWAEANRLVVLYPQAAAVVRLGAFNPKGSWDWWGYDDPLYFARQGRQMQAIARMTQTLSHQA